jgi:hypothetical protein
MNIAHKRSVGVSSANKKLIVRCDDFWIAELFSVVARGTVAVARSLDDDCSPLLGEDCLQAHSSAKEPGILTVVCSELQP